MSQGFLVLLFFFFSNYTRACDVQCWILSVVVVSRFVSASQKKMPRFSQSELASVSRSVLSVQRPDQRQSGKYSGVTVSIADYQQTNPRPENETESENRNRVLYLDLALVRQCCGLRSKVSPPPDWLPTHTADTDAVCVQALTTLARCQPKDLRATPHGVYGYPKIIQSAFTPGLNRVRIEVRVQPACGAEGATDTPDSVETGRLVQLDVPANGLSWMARSPVQLVAYVLRRALALSDPPLAHWFPDLSREDREWIESHAAWARNEWGEWEPVVTLVGTRQHAATAEWIQQLLDRYRSTWQATWIHAPYGESDKPAEVPPCLLTTNQ